MSGISQRVYARELRLEGGFRSSHHVGVRYKFRGNRACPCNRWQAGAELAKRAGPGAARNGMTSQPDRDERRGCGLKIPAARIVERVSGSLDAPSVIKDRKSVV